MAIKYAGLKCELREVVLANKPAQMLTLSPKGTVPVLALGDRVIDESLDVMRWSLQATDVDGWNVAELDHPLVERNDGYFKSKLDRYKYFERYPEYSQQSYMHKGVLFLNELEASMVTARSGQHYLLAPKLSVLDIAIFPFVRQFAFVDKEAFDALNLPKVQSWLEELLVSELFLSVMIKRHPWSTEQDQQVYV